MNRFMRATIAAVAVILPCLSFSQSKQTRNSLTVFHMAGWPLEPGEFNEYWRPGNGIGIEYGSQIATRVEWTVSAAYVQFGANGQALASRFNPYLTAGGAFFFSHGEYKAGLFKTSLAIVLSDPHLPVVFFVRAGAGLHLLYQRDLSYSERYPSGVVDGRIRLGGSEATPAIDAGLGLEFRLAKRIMAVLEGGTHCLFTKDLVGNEDRKAEMVSRAQGKTTLFAHLQTGLRYLF